MEFNKLIGNEKIKETLNSIIQKSINDMIRHSDMNWNMEPEFMDISLKQIKLNLKSISIFL